MLGLDTSSSCAVAVEVTLPVKVDTLLNCRKKNRMNNSRVVNIEIYLFDTNYVDKTLKKDADTLFGILWFAVLTHGLEE